MKNKIKKTDFSKLNESEMKCIYGGDGIRKIEVVIDGKIIIIYI